MLKTCSIALGLAALCFAGAAQAQTDDLSKFNAGQNALAAQPAGTLNTNQAAPFAGVDGKFRVNVPAPGAVATVEPSMAMNAGMSRAQTSGPLPGLSPALSDNSFGAKDTGGANGGGRLSDVVPASSGLLGIETTSSTNVNAAAFGAANNVKLGVQ